MQNKVALAGISLGIAGILGQDFVPFRVRVTVEQDDNREIARAAGKIGITVNLQSIAGVADNIALVGTGFSHHFQDFDLTAAIFTPAQSFEAVLGIGAQ